MVFLIRKEPEPYSSTGVAYRAYHPDGSPLYMGEETMEALVKRLEEFYPGVETREWAKE